MASSACISEDVSDTVGAQSDDSSKEFDSFKDKVASRSLPRSKSYFILPFFKFLCRRQLIFK